MPSDSPRPTSRKDRGKSFSWNRVLVILAITWLAVMAGIYWIIKSSVW